MTEAKDGPSGQAGARAVDLSKLAFPERVAHYIQRGELGRAREILACRISQRGFDPDALEQLGIVFHAMGDSTEAGRQLFLSGRRHPDYHQAIAAFLHRCRDVSLSQFVSQWPASIRRTRVLALPLEVQSELKARGMGSTMQSCSLEDLRQGNNRRSVPWTKLCLFLLAAITVFITYLLLRPRW